MIWLLNRLRDIEDFRTAFKCYIILFGNLLKSLSSVLFILAWLTSLLANLSLKNIEANYLFLWVNCLQVKINASQRYGFNLKFNQVTWVNYFKISRNNNKNIEHI